MRFKVILALVNDEYQDDVIKAAKNAGATGVTILIIFWPEYGIPKRYAPFPC